MKKISTVRVNGNMIFKGHKLTIGLGHGDRWSFYCVLDEAGKIILEQKVSATLEAIKQTFGKIPRSLIALETGTHFPWLSRLLKELGHAVLVAHAQRSTVKHNRVRQSQRVGPLLRSRRNSRSSTGAPPSRIIATRTPSEGEFGAVRISFPSIAAWRSSTSNAM